MHLVLKRSLSQHLLKDKNILRKMLSRAGIKKEDIVLEIGAGTGEMTALLKDMAGMVYAVEIDRNFSEYLDEIASKNENVKVIYGDFLKLELEKLGSKGSFKVVGNIPYGITGPILDKIFRERKYMKSAFILVQREVAERMTAKPKSRAFGALSVVSQILAEVKIEFIVPPQVFVPQPEVESAFVSIVFREESKDVPQAFFAFVRKCFRHKRKLLINSLKATYPLSLIHPLFEKARLERSVRAEEIPPHKFLEMFHFIEGKNE